MLDNEYVFYLLFLNDYYFNLKKKERKMYKKVYV